MLILWLLSILLFRIRWPCMHLIYTPGCKLAQNFDSVLIYDFFLSFCFIYGDHACISSILQVVSYFDTMLILWLLSILLFRIRWPCMHLIYTPGCKLAQNFDSVLIYDFFLSFCFIYGDHACISSILPVCKFAQNFDAILINDLFSILLFHIRWPCMHLIYTPVCKFARNFDAMLIYDFFLSFCFIYVDHACISSILQVVSLLKTLMQY